MSSKNPIIAITGSAGSGTTTVRRIFENIFRRTNVKAGYIHGNSFRKYSRNSLQKIFEDSEKKGKAISYFSPEITLLDRLEGLFREYSRNGTGCIRDYIESEEQAYHHQQPIGTFSPWVELPEETELLFYEGQHGGCAQAIWSKRDLTASHNPFVIQQRLKQETIEDTGVDIAKWVDLLIGIVPAINLEWMHKIQQSCNISGCTKADAANMIVQRMDDYVRYMAPQFSITDINFQRIPLVDTSNPFEIDDIPLEEECLLVIRFRDPKKHDIKGFAEQFPNAYLSRPNTLVVRNSYMAQAIETICSPLIEELMNRSLKP